MAISKHQELSQHLRGNPHVRVDMDSRTIQFKDVVRLSPKEFDTLSEQALAKCPDIRNTDAGSLGIRAGIYTVLEMVRKGFTHA